MQYKGCASICNAWRIMPSHLTFKMEATECIRQVTSDVNHHIADRHAVAPHELCEYTCIVVFHGGPSSERLRTFESDVDDGVVVLIPNGSDTGTLCGGKSKPILLKHRGNLLPLVCFFVHHYPRGVRSSQGRHGSGHKPPNASALSRAAPIRRNSSRTRTKCYNAPDLVAASGVGWSALLGRTAIIGAV